MILKITVLTLYVLAIVAIGVLRGRKPRLSTTFFSAAARSAPG